LEGGKCLNLPSILIPVATPIVYPPTLDFKGISLLFSMALVEVEESRGTGLSRGYKRELVLVLI
jgi:hypothetical protein